MFVCIFYLKIGKIIKKKFRRLLAIINEFTKRLRIISLFLSGAMNLLYIVSNILSGLFYRSLWFFSLTLLHTVLLWIRYYLFAVTKDGEEDTAVITKTVRRISYGLYIIDTLSLALFFYSIIGERAPEFKEMSLYPFLAYSVYSFGVSIYGLLLSAKKRCQLYAAHRNITMTTALFSIFNLLYTVYLSSRTRSEALLVFVSFVGAVIFSVNIMLAVLLSKAVSQHRSKSNTL